MSKVLKQIAGPLLHLRPILMAAIFFLLTVLLFSRFAEAAELVDELDRGDGMIEVQYAPDLLEPYRDRRSNWSTQFSFGIENFRPKDFTSHNDGLSYSDLFGTNDVRLFQGSVGRKYNLSLGAISIDASYAFGSVKNSKSGTVRELALIKKAISASYVMDAIFSEPYVAPYFTGQILEVDFSDKGSVNGDSSGRTAMSTGLTLGLLIQLNFIDPTAAAYEANRDFGLNNTFLDLFVSQYNTSESSDDVNLESAMNWGAGLRFEF